MQNTLFDQQPKTRPRARFRAAVRRWRKLSAELEQLAGRDTELIGEVLDLDDEWREIGRRLEGRMSE